MCCRGRTTAASRLRVKDAARWRRRRRRLFYGDMTTLKAPPALFYGLRWRINVGKWEKGVIRTFRNRADTSARVRKFANIGEDRDLQRG
ncbi:hypothetical protein B296_00058977 [Ensete ventricosum]|uniref:Uncharacterized protein n=1 Tax=Ensete ventricosum TaxID=4639 RepID=A0A426WWG4_ENSVE|nr:hypothetical protein B296_00058977 [Ensete ventricosum]